MGMTIHTPDQTMEQIEIGQPKCKCGNAFLVYRHKTVRKKQFLGITALCENVDCDNHEPFIAHSEAEMLHTLTCNSNQTSSNMSNPKHSPAPWSNGKDANGNLLLLQDPDQGNEYAIESQNPEYVANFHLVNTAPDLLKEMERYLPIFERLEKTHPGTWQDITQGTGTATLNGYRFAIAKAKGETI